MPLRSSGQRAEETEGWSTVSAPSPSPPLTGIVTAVPEELEPLVARASDLAWERTAGSPVLSNVIASPLGWMLGGQAVCVPVLRSSTSMILSDADRTATIFRRLGVSIFWFTQ